ncbi:MAG: DUF2771 domain-containing protein [Pseudonocardia sp.]|nr:DUF2771 domain-containing protein [Pseudonocardia sp.]
MARRLLLALLVAPAALLAGCGASDSPEVTWTVGDTERTVGPTQFCDIEMKDCADDQAARITLPVPAGTGVRVAVPEEVSTAPWTVVFSYSAPDGTRTDGRSPLFTPNAQRDYTLTLPDPADTLITAQVQLLGAAPGIDPETGEVSFPTRGTWVLVADGAATP